MTRESVSDSVSQVMFAALTGHPDPLLTRWTYRADDPFAVTVAVQTPRGRWVEWLVGRELLAKGLTNREIGLQLSLAEKTVKHYVTSVLQKLHVRSRVEAALLVQRQGKHL